MILQDKISFKRNSAIDFTKGVLVILMVLYHCLNYLDYGTIPHDYMSFLPPSFLLITGIIISRIYLPRMKKNEISTSKRLAIRFLKLFFIFSFLNIIARIFFNRNQYGLSLSLESFFANWYNIYILGSPKEVAFDVLLPISYTILISIILLKLGKEKSSIILMVSVILLTLCFILDKIGYLYDNFSLASFGFTGMAIGLINYTKINDLSKYWSTAILLLIIQITCTVVIFDSYFKQVILTVISVALFYVVGTKINLKHTLTAQTVLLGQYSLLSYIVQILYIQFYNVVNNMLGSKKTGLIILTASVLFLTWITVFITRYLREKFKKIDGLYLLSIFIKLKK